MDECSESKKALYTTLSKAKAAELLVNDGTVIVFSELETQDNIIRIESIEDGAFEGRSDITALIIMDGVTEIGAHLFSEDNHLRTVVLPSTLKRIKRFAFYGCAELEVVRMTDNVKEIGQSAFHGCESLQEIIIPKCVSELEANTFRGCKSLKDVTVDCIRLIGEGAFRDCSALETVAMGDRVKFILSNAFEGCSSLKAVYLPFDLKRLDAHAFKDCTSLETVRVDLDTHMEINAFVGCTKLKELTIEGGKHIDAEYVKQEVTDAEQARGGGAVTR